MQFVGLSCLRNVLPKSLLLPPPTAADRLPQYPYKSTITNPCIVQAYHVFATCYLAMYCANLPNPHCHAIRTCTQIVFQFYECRPFINNAASYCSASLIGLFIHRRVMPTENTAQRNNCLDASKVIKNQKAS